MRPAVPCRSRCSPARWSPASSRSRTATPSSASARPWSGGISSALSRGVHPPRGRLAHRRLEHGRDDPHRRLLRHRAAERHVVLRRDGDRLRAGGAGHRQLVDHRRHPGRRIRGAGADPRRRPGHRGRRGDLRRLLRRQDDADLRDDRPRADDGRRRDDPGAHRRHAVDVRAGHRPVDPWLRDHRPAGRATCDRLRPERRAGDPGGRVQHLAAQPPADGAPRRPVDPPRAPVPRDLRQRDLRGRARRLHPARRPWRRSSARRPEPSRRHSSRSTRPWRPGSCQQRQRDDRLAVLARRDGVDAQHDLARARRAVLRRGDGGRRIPGAADPARSSRPRTPPAG